MDYVQYEHYSYVIMNRKLSLNALKRIIKHDDVSGWSERSDALARKQVLRDCLSGKIESYKLKDNEGDELYGVRWPLPLQFVSDAECQVCFQ